MDKAAIILLVANILSFIGNMCFTSSSLFKKRKHILILQSINHFISSIAQALQGAWAGMVQDSVCLLRNASFVVIKNDKKKLNIIMNVFFILLALGVGIALNVILSDNVWYGYLPIISCAMYSSLVLFTFIKPFNEARTEFMLKGCLIINSCCWGIYGVCVQLYPILIFNGITLVISIISVIRLIIMYHKHLSPSNPPVLQNTVLCYIENDNKYLMLHRNKKHEDINSGYWIGVGGHIEENETPYEAIKREIKEETNLDAIDIEEYGKLRFYYHDIHFEDSIVYVCKSYSGKLGKCDEGTLKWVDKNKIYSLNLWEGDRLFLNMLIEDKKGFDLSLYYKRKKLVRSERNDLSEIHEGNAE